MAGGDGGGGGVRNNNIKMIRQFSYRQAQQHCR